MGPWHQTILGFSGGAVVAASASRWGEVDPWIILGAVLLFVGTLAHGWRPRWNKMASAEERARLRQDRRRF